MNYLLNQIILTAFLFAAIASTARTRPQDLCFTRFSTHILTPSPACLGVHSNGNVFVGVDLNGSLGKKPNNGRIVRLQDTNNDGKADQHTIFAEISHPRGIIPMGHKVYVLHGDYSGGKKIQGMHLSVFEDIDDNGEADAPPRRLVKDISTLELNQKRGADHTTNGISMGIDGWIYVAVGDFGFLDAKGTDGTTMTLLGGGIIRVRPDGSNMEMYTQGTRNIYDLAIDPFMNIFTRGNTNDGVGWWMRFTHHIQSGDYGYPSLYSYFTDEIIPALSQFGGGSGTGAHFLDEPTWPAKYNKQPLLADWGRSQIYIHSVTANGPTFDQEIKEFIKVSQPTDLDIDGSGRMYISSWNGAGYEGNNSRGFVERVTPIGLKIKPFPDLQQASTSDLLDHLSSKSAKARLCAQQEILERDNPIELAKQVLPLVNNEQLDLEARVAALFTFGQLTGKKGNETIIKLIDNDELKEFALRLATDDIAIARTLDPAPFVAALKDKNPRVRASAVIALGRIGNAATAEDLIKLAVTKERTYPAPLKNEPLIKTGAIRRNQTRDLSVKLEQHETLFLVANNSGSNGGEHIAWFNPRISANGKTFELTEWKKAEQGWGSTTLNKSCNNKALKRADGIAHDFGIGSHTDSIIEFKIPQSFTGGTFSATVGFADTAKNQASASFSITHSKPTRTNRPTGAHDRPNVPIIIPHLAVQSLRKLNNVTALLAAIDGPAQDGAIWALRRMHNPDGVEGLIAKLKNTSDQTLRNKLMDALARLYSVEAPFKAAQWWGTQPDPHGPYYKATTWRKSEEIGAAYRHAMKHATVTQRLIYKTIAENNKAFIPGVNEKTETEENKFKKIGQISIEDIMLALQKKKPNLMNGKKLLKTQACIACHSIEDNDAKKGPDLNKIGTSLNKPLIAEAILKPNATIASNWVDITSTAGITHNGTLVSKGIASLIVRNIAGIETNLAISDVQSIDPAKSTLMGPHLLDTLSLQEFIDVVGYLSSKK